MERYVPDMYKESIYDINYDKLKEIGIKIILLDLDNTLISYKQKLAEQKLIDFLDKLKKDFDFVIYSNGPKKRVERVKEQLGIEGFHCVNKPLKKGFDKVLAKFKYKENEVAIIGDQMLTDIAFGNSAGITTILIKPLSKKEPIWTKINRTVERKKMKKLRDNNLFTIGRYYE